MCVNHRPMSSAQMAFEKRKARLAREKEEWCECGEHYVPREMMWPNFADCRECATPKEYAEQMGVTVDEVLADEEECETCARCEKSFRYYLHDATCDDCSSYFVCKDCEMLMEGCGICGK